MNLKEGMGIIYDVLLFIGMAIVYSIETLVLTLIPDRYRFKSIKGEIALVTGGASGIGKLIAMKLAKLGAHVVIWDIDEKSLVETVEEIKNADGICHMYRCDISDKEEVYRTAKAMQIEIGNASLLVNNAGFVNGKTFVDLTDHEVEHTFKVNIMSHYWITKSFLKDMLKNNHGHIVTISSIAGLTGNYNMSDYSATKFATIGLHESLRTELKVQGYDGIHTTLVCPYAINTQMFQGTKFRMPILEAKLVAEKIVNGILINKMLIVLPNVLTYLIPFKYWLPSKIWWALTYGVFQAPQGMMTFKKCESKMINK